MSRAAAAIQAATELFESGQPERAKEALRRYLQRAPADAEANKVLAMIHGALREDDQAYIFIARAAQAGANSAEIQFMLGNVSTIVKKYKEGSRAYTAALRLNPDNLEAYDGLCKCLLSQGEYAAAMEWYERGIARAPANPDLYFRMGVSLALLGRIDEALAAARRGLANAPDDPSLLEFLVYYQNFADGVDPVRHKDEHARLGRVFASRVPAPAPFTNDRDPDRPLRVGFISADFYFHACAMFLEGPLRALDRAAVTPYLYALPTKTDEVTERFMGLGVWRDCRGLSPEEIGAGARADGIDIMVECCGWTERSVMTACAAGLAPVQATYLGYPNTTGLPTVTHRVIDAHTDPPGSEPHCTERLVRLPETFLCYRPPADAPAEVDWTPPSAAGVGGAPVTFGSFNRIMKVGPRAVQTWARVLKAVPGSRLLIKIQIAAREVGPHFIGRFETLGIDPARIITAEYTRNPGEHFPVYRRMDIALDSFPYNGTTTTCEGAWMGVPMIALAGATHRSRVGVSLLHALGLPELIARDEDDYVRIAAELAADPARLAMYHRTLRGTMAASPLTDPVRFARQFEAALRGMWREWCAGPRA